jgi:hypothetical protein
MTKYEEINLLCKLDNEAIDKIVSKVFHMFGYRDMEALPKIYTEKMAEFAKKELEKPRSSQ